MKQHVKTLKIAAITACGLRGFPCVQFMKDYGLEDILIDADTNDISAKELAARVLAECCVEDGKFNKFQVGLLTVLSFLRETFGQLPQGEQQSIRDLVSILDSGGSFQAIMDWMDTHYS